MQYAHLFGFGRALGSWKALLAAASLAYLFLLTLLLGTEDGRELAVQALDLVDV